MDFFWETGKSGSLRIVEAMREMSMQSDPLKMVQAYGAGSCVDAGGPLAFAESPRARAHRVIGSRARADGPRRSIRGRRSIGCRCSREGFWPS